MTITQIPRVHVIGTGGSIAGMGHSRLDLTEYGETGRKFSIDGLLERLPEANSFAQISAEEFSNVASNSFSSRDWLRLAKHINQLFSQEAGPDGIVITHGTMTLEETAYFLNLTVKSDRPVVLTGAVRPPTALSTDADLNILDAILVAASHASKDKGVLAILNGEIQAAREVTKTNTYRLETFRSPDFGFLGYADADHQVVFYRSPTRKHTRQTEFHVEETDDLPSVAIVYSYAGADGNLIRYLIDAGVEGIVTAGVGSGNPTPSQLEALIEAHEQGVAIVASSRLGSGRVVLTERRKTHGFIAADSLNPQKARILLMLGLALTRDVERLQQMFYEY